MTKADAKPGNGISVRNIEASVSPISTCFHRFSVPEPQARQCIRHLPRPKWAACRHGPPARVLAKLVSYLQNPSALALGDVLIVEGLQQPIGGAVHISE